MGRKGWARALITALLVIGADQASKQVVLHHMSLGESIGLFPGLDLTRTRNSGVAFGALAGQAWIVALLIFAALALLIGYFARNSHRPLIWLPSGMLFGGALGNLLDRWRHGSVVDFIDPIAWPSFNLADATIVCGVPLLLWVAGREPAAEDEARASAQNESEARA